MIHLTFTGVYAGRMLCGEPRTLAGEYWHASYAPLGQEQHRAKVCPTCLKMWANYAWDDCDDMPGYIKDLRK